MGTSGEILYNFGPFFMAYVMYRYVRIFYRECKVEPRWEIAAYATYAISKILMNELIPIPLFLAVSNTLCIYLLILMYEGTQKKAVLSVSTIALSLICLEMFMIFLLDHAVLVNLFNPVGDPSELVYIITSLIIFVFVTWVAGFKNVRENQELPNIYFIGLFAIPLCTIILLMSTIHYMPDGVLRALCVLCALVINVLTFYLYDKVSELLTAQINKRLLEEQSRYYAHQVEMMQDSLENMRMLRHDLKNKLSPLYRLAGEHKTTELLERLSELIAICNIDKEYANSGNAVIDSIINFKLQNAKAEGIAVSTDLLLPADLSIPAFDIAVVLGNLMDNALEATIRTKTRWIEIKAKYEKGRFILDMQNTFDGIVKKVGTQYCSRKADGDNHGIGLKSVRSVLQRYNGDIRITHDDKVFKVKLLMYLP